MIGCPDCAALTHGDCGKHVQVFESGTGETWKFTTPGPFCCPVCEGRGTVRFDFYTQRSDVSNAAWLEPVTCRACKGEGVVWR